MPATSPPPPPPSNGNGVITKLDYPGTQARKPLLQAERDSLDGSGRPSQDNSYAGSFFEQVAEGIQEQDRKKMAREVLRWGSFVWAVVNCLCAGSITAYSLYGHIFQSRLHYTQFQVNIVSITAELAMYLPVPIFGYLCDRLGPGIPSALAAVFFGVGYALAAFTYKSGPPPSAGGDGWPFAIMVIAFIGIGMGTSCMYLSAVTTCAKNFGRGKYKGIALAVPIAAFGLSGMWQSQVGTNLLYERKSDGSKGDVDVFLFFMFLCLTLFCVGMIGLFTLRVQDEGEMIDEAVEELERSGLLEEDEFFTRAAHQHGYGTVPQHDLSDSTYDFLRSEAEVIKNQEEAKKLKKTWLLNGETRRFLLDPTMWWLGAGFVLVSGPGEAFINNLGTIIGTLYPPTLPAGQLPTSAATHVSIVAITSTLARLLTGTLSDLLAPSSVTHQHRRPPHSLANSIESLSQPAPLPEDRKFSISRMTFLLFFSLLLSIGQVFLASGLVQGHGDRFWVVSTLVGAGYGAVFSLVPIIISVVWGVENFGTNWGILAMSPALGATIWGIVYSEVYQSAAAAVQSAESEAMVDLLEQKPDVLCFGKGCYAPTFWAMAVSVWVACGLWVWAWKGPGGWSRRGIAV